MNSFLDGADVCRADHDIVEPYLVGSIPRLGIAIMLGSVLTPNVITVGM
jgi:hypothetical protein